MAQLGTMVPHRLTSAELPSDFVATVKRLESKSRRQKFGWDADSYGTLSVRVYKAEDAALPKGGLTLKAADFAVEDGTDKSRYRRAQIVHRSPLGTDANGAADSLLVTVEGPADYEFEAVTIKI